MSVKLPNITLICDTRERNVLKHKAELDQITYEIKQISVGDYIITTGDNILAVIERKSLDDFAASLKDGRHANKEKLLKLRSETGCRILYIIEGNPFPADGSYFGGISYKNIQSSIFHLMVRDGIPIIYTEDTLHTAKTLVNFTRSMSTLVSKISPDEFFVETPIELLPCNIPAAITKKYEKTDHDIVRMMWSTFPGIAMENSDHYMNKWSIYDVIKGLPPAELTNLKSATGRRVGKRVIKGLTVITPKVEIKLLSTLPGISPATAEKIINKHKLGHLLSLTIEILSTYDAGERKIGLEKSKKIIKYFNYKYDENERKNAKGVISTNEFSSEAGLVVENISAAPTENPTDATDETKNPIENNTES